jgi:glutathione S-transferase
MEIIGASPTAGGMYTVPVIKDPNTAVVYHSHAIAKYLDETYPDKPLIPRRAHVLLHTFESLFMDSLKIVLRALHGQNPRDTE